MTDQDLMPFGKYKGEKMGGVLIWFLRGFGDETGSVDRQAGGAV